MATRRVGILGGTFDPIHYGHLFIADAVRELAQLDSVLFMPVGEPAHREVHASASDRTTMVELGIFGNPLFALDRTALDQPGPVYTADSLAILHANCPDDELNFIAGVDSLTVSRWRRLDEVASLLTRFYVVLREGTSSHEIAGVIGHLSLELRQRFVVLDLPLVDISASVIRDRVKAGRTIRYLVPDSVGQYIDEKRLYRG